jgi:hypothetical protein
MDLVDNPNLLFTAGEAASDSDGDVSDDLKKFAYRSQQKSCMLQTQALQWYKEEMFTRFQPYLIKGNWPGFKIPEDLKYLKSL